MSKVVTPEITQENIALDKLLFEVMRKKDQGLRLSQICVAYVNEKYELSYSFANDETYAYTTLRVVIDLYEKVPSICNIYPYAIFYENEMAELFDVNIEMMDFDFHGKFYRINEEAPMLPKGVLEKKAQQEEDAIKRAEEEKRAAEEAARKAEEEAKAAEAAKAKAIAEAKAKAAAAKAAAAAGAKVAGAAPAANSNNGQGGAN